MNEHNSAEPDAPILSLQDADRIIRSRTGLAALLYIYILRMGSIDLERASRDLYLPLRTVQENYEIIKLCGIDPEKAIEKKTGGTGKSVSPAASCTEPEIVSRQKTESQCCYDGVFSALATELEAIMGRPATTADLRKLMEIYKDYHIAPEAIMQLINYVAEQYQERYGDKRRPTMTAIMKQAALWRSEGVTGLDLAEQYIADRRRVKEQENEIREALHIIDRDLTDGEREYVDAWVGLGFPAETIALAYDIAVTSKGIRSPAYVNGILKNWHSNGHHSPEEVLQGEKIRKSSFSTDTGSQSRTIDKNKLEILRNALSKEKTE